MPDTIFVKHRMCMNHTEGSIVLDATILGKFFELTQDFLCVLDFSGVLVATNPACERFLGIPSAKAHNQKLIDFIFSDDTILTTKMLEDAASKNSACVFITRCNKKSAQQLWLEWRVVRIDNYLYATAHDVTDQIESTNALIQSESKFHSLFDNMAEGVALHELLFDELGKPVNYRIIDVNPWFEAIIGIKRSDAENAVATDLYKTDTPAYLKEYSEVALTRIPYTFETYFSPLQKHFQISVTPWGDAGFATIFLDITGRKQYEEKLASEKERLLVTLRSIGDGVITTDVEGRVVLINTVAEILTGWNAADAQGRPLAQVFTIVNQITRIPCENPVSKVLETGAIIGLANHTALLARNGKEYMIADSGAPIRNSEGTIIGVVLVFRDVTEKHHTESLLQNAQRLESLGVLAGGIAHDFNNLLGGIFGFVEVAREYLNEGKLDEVTYALDSIGSVFERARDLTRQLLTFSKGGAPIKSNVNVGVVVENAVKFVLSGSNAKADLYCQPHVPDCLADSGQISQVIDNLLINARQAMPLGGTIAIRVTTIALSDDPPPTLAKGEYIHVMVADGGVGIAPEHLAYIFDPFFTTKQQGNGLGLATSFSIIKKHDGIITVDSVLGKGATFHVYLPVTRGVQEHKSIPHAVITHGSGRVLIMDDESFILELVKEMLVPAGYIVVCSENTSEALSICKECAAHGKLINYALLDLTIPGGPGGREIAHEVRQLFPAIRIIASSGYSSDVSMSQPKAAGFDTCLVKPYRKAELLHVLGSSISA